MPSRSGINRVFLMGKVNGELRSETVKGEGMLSFQLAIPEILKKAHSSYEHIEYHNIKAPVGIVHDLHIKVGDWLYVQGQIKTHIECEAGVRLFKTEVFAFSVERFLAT